MNWEICRRKRSWKNLRYYSGISIEELRKIMGMSLSCRDSKWELPGRKSEGLPLEPTLDLYLHSHRRRYGTIHSAQGLLYIQLLL
jgi:hypothetical protein